MTRVYLDHNATTPLREEARRALVATIEEGLGNPSSSHTRGRAARAHVDDARARVAAALGVLESEVVFTSGATEANNLALCGAARALGPGSTLITSRIEHPSVIEPLEALARDGLVLNALGVDSRGHLDPGEVLEACERAAGPVLLSLGIANGEVGSVAPLDELARMGLGERTTLHVDGAQALGRLPLALVDWGVSLASFSAHKVGGPPGVGVLVRRANAPLEPLLRGGGQEAELRAGTENVPSIVSAAIAVELAVAEQETYLERTGAHVRLLCEEVGMKLPAARQLGPDPDTPRLPNTVNFEIEGHDGRVLVARLDLEGLEASAGSACASGSLEPSPVLLALGLDRERARSGVRLSVGRTTTTEDIYTAVEILRRTTAGA